MPEIPGYFPVEECIEMKPSLCERHDLTRHGGGGVRRILSVAFFLILACAAPVWAATFTVTKTADTNDGACDADCSLREAFAAANAVNTADVIEFDAVVFSTPQTVTLTGGELIALPNRGNLTVNGTGANLLTVSGNNQSRIIYVAPDNNVVINNLKMTAGNGTGASINNAGGAIVVYASLLTLNNVIISGNAASSGGGVYGFFDAELNISNSTVNNNTAHNGGGVYVWSDSTLRINASSVSENTATGGGGGVYLIDTIGTINNSSINGNNSAHVGGGGVYATDSNLTVTSSSINNNLGNGGGGILGVYSTINVSDSLISGNRSTGAGGGINRNSGSGTLTVTRTRVLNNTASQGGGGIYSIGGLSITDSTVSGNAADTGGGVSNDGAPGAVITSSTIADNTANGGGGIYCRAPLRLINSTVSRNFALLEGGGINSIRLVETFYTTIAFNRAMTGAGVFIVSGTLQSISTIFADNIRLDLTAEDIFGTLVSGGYNLVESLQNTILTGNPSGNIIEQNALLDPILRSNGGFTPTHALRPNSPAIDAALNSGLVTTSVDQRGRPRPFDFPSVPNAPGGDGSDIGAFERQFNDNPVPTIFDFDGDGKADISVFRPGSGTWYLNQSQNGFAAAPFGIAGDKLVPADYDGDGRTDLAVYRGGSWYIQRSTAGFIAVTFGTVNDVPVPADYDGDGKAELAVFREGAWHIYNLTNNQTSSVSFGTSGDRPVPADYDGNGKSDVAVYRGGVWYILLSGVNQLKIVNFGLAADRAIPADYDGDGKADVAVFRPSNGTWYRLNSGDNSFAAIAFGLAEDKPAPADYDGDGRTDIAVFRPSNGSWYLLRSSAGFSGLRFGDPNDLPIANVYVR